MALSSPPTPSVESSKVTTNLDLLNQQLSTIMASRFCVNVTGLITRARIEVMLLFDGVEDLKGFKIKKLVPKGSLEELKGFNCICVMVEFPLSPSLDRMVISNREENCWREAQTKKKVLGPHKKV
ncbi:hypothetical protein M9H77_23104 [Catharanthus roseus]|uniref:Uncharacterized protein n=1 Tax=Catharanthus roseus TaxID=4058 RepID=A0ACC0AWD4_CATRO|nr:hypothetical protein M9H77_23104 [Catharanthus roseus]